MEKKHAEVNMKFDKMFSDEVRAGWLRMIRDWEKDTSQPNPFTYKEKGGCNIVISRSSHRANVHLAGSLAEVRKRLAEADKEDAKRGIVPHEVTGSVFIRTGLEIEEQMHVFLPLPPSRLLIPRAAGDSSRLQPTRSPKGPPLRRHHSKRGATPLQFGSTGGAKYSSCTCPVLQPPLP